MRRDARIRKCSRIVYAEIIAEHELNKRRLADALARTLTPIEAAHELAAGRNPLRPIREPRSAQ